MTLQVTVPISTEVIESNPDCTISGTYKNGVLMITIDTRHQNIHQRLGLSTKTKLHWGEEHVFDIQELSAWAWPIRYRQRLQEMEGQTTAKPVALAVSLTGLDISEQVRVFLAGLGAQWPVRVYCRGEEVSPMRRRQSCRSYRSTLRWPRNLPGRGTR